MYIALTEQELEALQGTDYALPVLYLYLKRFMDYKTGVVGYARRISYQSMSEAMYIEPRQGVKGGSPHVSSIRRMLEQLLKIGIIRKGRSDTLVFKLPYADTDKNAQNKADKNPTGKADSIKTNTGAEFEVKADIPKKAKADIPHLSLNTTNKAAAASHKLPIANNVPENAAAEFIFHKSLNQEAQAFMKNATKDQSHDMQQVLFDELSGFLEKKKIKSNPMGLFITFVGQLKTGTFIPVYATSVKNLRENPNPLAVEKAKPTEAEREATREKGRAAMQNVQSIFKRKVSNE